jgi:hypothetical protein
VETCSSASYTCKKNYIWKKIKSQILVEFQSFVFGQILANLGSFGQIMLHWQWLSPSPPPSPISKHAVLPLSLLCLPIVAVPILCCFCLHRIGAKRSFGGHPASLPVLFPPCYLPPHHLLKSLLLLKSEDWCPTRLFFDNVGVSSWNIWESITASSSITWGALHMVHLFMGWGVQMLQGLEGCQVIVVLEES